MGTAKSNKVVWSNVKTPAETKRAIDLLVARVSREGLARIPMAIAAPVRCPSCGAELSYGPEDDSFACKCGYGQLVVNRRTTTSNGLAISLAVAALTLALSGVEAGDAAGGGRSPDGGGLDGEQEDGRAAPERIVEALLKAGRNGATAKELGEALSLTPSNASTTVCLLRRDGKIRDSGKRRSRAVVWVLAERGGEVDPSDKMVPR